MAAVNRGREHCLGAEPTVLQTDITRDEAVDDNAFEAELATIVENSFNIHEDGATPRVQGRREPPGEGHGLGSERQAVRRRLRS